MTAAPHDKARRIYLLRSLLAPLVSYRWTKLIQGFHRDLGALEPVERILSKVVRSYLKRGLRPSARLSILRGHYDWVRATFSDGTLRKIASNEPIEIAAIEARKNSRYRVYLACSMVAILQREGELALFISKTPDGQKLCRLAFVFEIRDGEPTFVIGGLQGPSSAFKREVIDATREMFGLRPKDALLFALRCLAAELNINAVHAVSDRNHVLGRLQDKSKFSNYDAYWKERGALESPPYGFVFGPIEPTSGVADKRENAKSAIADSIREFVRNARRVPDAFTVLVR